MTKTYDYVTLVNFVQPENIENITGAVYREYDKDDIHGPAEGVTKDAKVLRCKWGYVQPFLHQFNDYLIDINSKCFGYSLYPMSALTAVNLTEYVDGGQYDWHIDGDPSKTSDCKLTAILNISDHEYTGGNFELFLNGPTHIKELDKPGGMVVFKSHISHRVLPVLTGQRRTLSIFLMGPKFV